MLAGQTSTYEGSEVCLFPMDILDCTQVSGLDTLSHCCGHACDYVGTHTEYPVFAPFSGTVISSSSSEYGNAINFCSDSPVWTLQGLTYVTVRMIHSNYHIPVGGHYQQGDLLYHTGITGLATGDHVHIDQSPIQNDASVYYGVICAYGNECYSLSGSVTPETIFYLTGDEAIYDTRGLDFRTWDGSPIYIRNKNLWWIYKHMMGGQ